MDETQPSLPPLTDERSLQSTDGCPLPAPAPDSSAAASSNKPRKSVPLTSPVWQFMKKCEETINGVTKKGVKCSICNLILADNGTGHLNRHLKMHQRAQAQLNPSQMLLNADAAGNLSTFTYDHAVARKEVVDFVVRAELPFTFVENNDFKGMIQRAFCPQYRGISATTCKRDVMKWFGEEKKELLAVFEKLDGRICLTSDIGSSRQKMGYMTITAHFIDADWKLNKRIICFKMIEYPHSGEAIASHIFDELLSWRITNKIFTLSLDNASNNDTAVSILPETLLIAKGLPEDLFHVRCCCHILNLIVQDGLAILGKSIDKITDIVRNMNSSNKRHEMWLAACAEFDMPKRNIDIDVPHRWNSTYLLLHVAIQYKAPLNRYVRNLKASSRHITLESPTEEDWSVAQLVCGFLEVFDSSTKIFSGVYYPTSSLVVQNLVEIHANFAAYGEFYIFSDALREMKTKFDKYWSEFPIVFLFAAVMDPRFKLFAIEAWLGLIGIDELEISSKIINLQEKLYEFYDIYKKNGVVATGHNVSSCSPVISNMLSQAPGSISVPKVRNVAMQTLKRARVSSTSSSTTSSDLHQYLTSVAIEVNEDTEFCVLTWWKRHEEHYPILARMARDLLTVPASTVASESSFSAGGRIISEKRASLNPTTVQALICLKDWKFAKSRMQDAARQEQEADYLTSLRAARPDWMEEATNSRVESEDET